MELNNLKPANGSVKNRKRIGRGTGSGHGGTSTRGHKGAQSRSGNSRKIGFEGGQMPLQRRLPKFGFKNINRIEYTGINLDVLQNISEKYAVTEFTQSVFVERGLASKNDRVKILGRGTLSAKVAVSAHAFTEAAKEAIEKVGGSVATI
jgi:large subunit ribosomal protein L15